ncbi:uncharacterized protein LOC108669415 isoform X2 [Hyalella azteca]|uniref:Uncharacterized protein LOC108669415 isoform X2 n=1 Tax=Hyalella azteca TaxID=294128 RepID=A0A8B7NF45_HYAAZ|nr:uncharacterized protein LOC108669415 isoform X2 [Hyalella azteca]
MGDKYLRYVKLEKSPSGGLGFSIIGGAGSELPPIIHQIVTGSPADLCKQLQPGDVILEVNGLPVETLTTKEVLNCLREAPDQVILKLRTDGSTDEHVQQLLAAASDPVLLQKAIQPEKKLPSKRKVGDTVPGVPPPLPPKAGSPISFSGLESPSATLDRSKKHKSPHSAPRMKNGVLDDSFEEGDEHFQSCFDISVPEKGDESRSAPGFDSSAERQAGESMDNHVPKQRVEAPINLPESTNSQCSHSQYYGESQSVPNSPGGVVDSMCGSNIIKCGSRSSGAGFRSSRENDYHQNIHNQQHGRAALKSSHANTSSSSNSSSLICVSCESPAASVMQSSCGSFTYSPPAVRISKSEDQLQCPDDGDVSSANTDLEDDVTASHNTLLDTREDQTPQPQKISFHKPVRERDKPQLSRQDKILPDTVDLDLVTNVCVESPSSSTLVLITHTPSVTTTTMTSTVTSANGLPVILCTTQSCSTNTSVLDPAQLHPCIRSKDCSSVTEDAVVTSAVITLTPSNNKSAAAQSPSGESLGHSSHESDSPLLLSPCSPVHSFTSHSSIVGGNANSYSGLYDKIRSSQGIESLGEACSNSSSLTTSPDTDIPDELEWDESTPSYVPSNFHSISVPSPLVNGDAICKNLPGSPHSSGHKPSQRSASSVHPPSTAAYHCHIVNVDTSSSSSSSLHHNARRKKDEHRIVIKVAGPEHSSSSSTLGKSNEIKNYKSSSSGERNNGSRRGLRSHEGSIVSSAGVTSALTTSLDGALAPSIVSVLTSSCGVGVIPGTDPDLTPTNTPHPTPPLSPARSLVLQRTLSNPRLVPRQSSTPNPHLSSSPPSHPQVSPQTPGSGTLSPDTLAYQQLWESEDELTNSFVSEEESSLSLASLSHTRSVGGVSRGSHKANSGGMAEPEDGGGGSGSGGKNTTASAAATTSPPLSEDESDIESLHSFHYSPKAVDIPSAVRLAKRLYLLDGFKKTDVSRHLSKNNEFSKAVAEEYLQHFDFKKKTLDEALRAFLERFCLLGETQERERVLVHFSRRYLDCNDGTFNSQDAVHTLTCALMLLNTDLHGAKKSMTRAMTCSEFITNLAELNDGQDFPPQVLRDLHTSIKNKPLKWAGDDEGNAVEGAEDRSDASPLLLGSNPFLAPSAGDGFIYKKGYIMRKCCIDPNGKKTSFGKRSWKMWWCVVQDLAMYLYKDEQCGVRGSTQQPQPGTLAVRLHHALATRAHDYNKKQHVFRLHTADHAVYLLQTSDSKELQAWIDAINFVAASLSAAPMAGAVGSQKKFQRPLLPCSATKLNLRDQTLDHEERLARLEEDLQQHLAKPPDKTAKTNTLANYREKEAYLNEQIKRYRAYVYLLRSKLAADVPPPPVPDLPVFSPGRDPHHDHAGDNGRVVAPPIPQRGGAAPSLPSDRTAAHPVPPRAHLSLPLTRTHLPTYRHTTL